MAVVGGLAPASFLFAGGMASLFFTRQGFDNFCRDAASTCLNRCADFLHNGIITHDGVNAGAYGTHPHIHPDSDYGSLPGAGRQKTFQSDLWNGFGLS